MVQISGPTGPKISYEFVLKKFQNDNFFGTPCRWSVDLKWMFQNRCYIHRRWSCSDNTRNVNGQTHCSIWINSKALTRWNETEVMIKSIDERIVQAKILIIWQRAWNWGKVTKTTTGRECTSMTRPWCDQNRNLMQDFLRPRCWQCKVWNINIHWYCWRLILCWARRRGRSEIYVTINRGMADPQ